MLGPFFLPFLSLDYTLPYMNTLYHYVHCPFCVRVRLALGYLDIEYNSQVLSYDNEKTPLELTGVKMLPIMDFGNGEIKNESLDIIKTLDQKNKLKNQLLDDQNKLQEIENLLSEIGKNVHSLCMPYWIYTPEFDDQSRQYFSSKKEMKRGPFYKLIQNKDQFINGLNQTLEEMEKNLVPFYSSNDFSIIDIMIASHLWGMYVFPEFQFSPKMNQYLQSIRLKCHFDYHQDFWKD